MTTTAPTDSPKMSFEEAKATINWWNLNKKHGSIEPKNVKIAKEVLEPLAFDKKDLGPIKLSKPISDFSLDDITAELDRLNVMLKSANEQEKSEINALKPALWNRRYILKKNANPQEIPQKQHQTATEIFEKAEKETIVIPQSGPETVQAPVPFTKVVEVKKYFTAIATFKLPVFTVEVRDTDNINEAIISELIRQVEVIARKELSA